MCACVCGAYIRGGLMCFLMFCSVCISLCIFNMLCVYVLHSCLMLLECMCCGYFAFVLIVLCGVRSVSVRCPNELLCGVFVSVCFVLVCVCMQNVGWMVGVPPAIHFTAADT